MKQAVVFMNESLNQLIDSLKMLIHLQMTRFTHSTDLFHNKLITKEWNTFTLFCLVFQMHLCDFV